MVVGSARIVPLLMRKLQLNVLVRPALFMQEGVVSSCIAINKRAGNPATPWQWIYPPLPTETAFGSDSILLRIVRRSPCKYLHSYAGTDILRQSSRWSFWALAGTIWQTCQRASDTISAWN